MAAWTLLRTARWVTVRQSYCRSASMPRELGGKKFDHLIVEIATNEQVALRSSLANFSTIQSVLDWAVQWCAERGVGVTFVIMPELASYTRAGDIRAFEVRRVPNGYAAKRQIQVFDGYEWLEDRARERGTEPADCFETPAHMNVEISHSFGIRIAESIDPNSTQSRRRWSTARSFEYVALSSAAGWADADTIDRSTSLGSAQLLRLQPGNGFDLELNRGAIVGTVHNVAATTATLLIEGDPSLGEALGWKPRRQAHPTAWGLRTPVERRRRDDASGAARGISPPRPRAQSRDGLASAQPPSPWGPHYRARGPHPRHLIHTPRSLRR